MIIVHLEAAAGDWGAPITVVVMRCGFTVYLDENGAGMPEGHDFVAPSGRAKPTCAGCLMPSASKTLRQSPVMRCGTTGLSLTLTRSSPEHA